MYHPDTMLYIAHKREAELVKDAELCAVSKTAGVHAKAIAVILALGLCCGLPFVWLFVLAVAHA
jgi:hypothetical protein